ncbi:unnamed protein product [Knipowitschia caucasica]|uniref:Sushi domain-containing protein n=1 Tax=Knipowitschia caucasica TaxID=637954 RepID=A0AAV2IWT2_KNICA
MDPDLLAHYRVVKLIFLVVYLLLGYSCSSGTATICPCGEIPQWNQTKPSTTNCSKVNYVFRYTCIDGYVRKAGTSNLIRCTTEMKWSSPSLKCIENPMDPPKRTTSPTTPSAAVTPSIHVMSSLSTETDAGMTSTFSPPQNTGATLLTSALTESSMNTPSPAAASSSASPAPHSTSIVSSTISTPMNALVLDRTTSPTHLSINSTLLRTGSVPINVIAPVVILLLLAVGGGAGFWLYKRSKRNTNKRISEEETIPMRLQNGDT